MRVLTTCGQLCQAVQASRQQKTLEKDEEEGPEFNTQGGKEL